MMRYALCVALLATSSTFSVAAVPKAVRAVVISPTNRMIAAGFGNQVHLFDAKTGAHLRTLAPAHSADVEALAFSPDGVTLASGSLREVVLWNVATGQRRASVDGFAHRVVSLDFSPDGKLLATAGGAPTVDGEVKLLDVGRGKIVRELKSPHSDTVYGVRFSPDGNMLATCGADQAIRIFQVGDGKLLKTLEGHTHHVLDVDWRSDGRILASAGADKKVRLWDFKTGEQLTRINRGGGAINTVFLDHPAQVNHVAFLGETSQLISTSGRQPARLWNLRLEERPGNYAKPYYRGSVGRELPNENDYLYAVAGSDDGTLIATGGRKGVVLVYGIDDDEKPLTLIPPEKTADTTPSISRPTSRP